MFIFPHQSSASGIKSHTRQDHELTIKSGERKRTLGQSYCHGNLSWKGRKASYLPTDYLVIGRFRAGTAAGFEKAIAPQDNGWSCLNTRLVFSSLSVAATPIYSFSCRKMQFMVSRIVSATQYRGLTQVPHPRYQSRCCLTSPSAFHLRKLVLFLSMYYYSVVSIICHSAGIISY